MSTEQEQLDEILQRMFDHAESQVPVTSENLWDYGREIHDLLSTQQEAVTQSLEVAVDQLVYARQREWANPWGFGFNRLRLRDLIVETVRPYATPQPVEPLRRVREELLAALRDDDAQPNITEESFWSDNISHGEDGYWQGLEDGQRTMSRKVREVLNERSEGDE